MILCIGLAVGIDYSLFYLRREREGARRGRSPVDALRVAAATPGRAVLISGFTVMIAMTGMFLMGSQVFTSFAIGTVLVVAIALVGSLTVLPAVLSRLGDRVDRGRVPGLSANSPANAKMPIKNPRPMAAFAYQVAGWNSAKQEGPDRAAGANRRPRRGERRPAGNRGLMPARPG